MRLLPWTALAALALLLMAPVVSAEWYHVGRDGPCGNWVGEDDDYQVNQPGSVCVRFCIEDLMGRTGCPSSACAWMTFRSDPVGEGECIP